MIMSVGFGRWALTKRLYYLILTDVNKTRRRYMFGKHVIDISNNTRVQGGHCGNCMFCMVRINILASIILYFTCKAKLVANYYY